MKTNKDILDQEYINAKELMQIMPINYMTSLEYIKEAQEEMKSKGYLVPRARPIVALTKIIKRNFGI